MQADLFNLSLSNSYERDAFNRSFFEKKYTLRLDQLLGAGIILIVFFVLVFAWGVERGKLISQRELTAQKNFQIQNSEAAKAASAVQVSAPAEKSSNSISLQSAPPLAEVSVDNAPVGAPNISKDKTVISRNAKYTVAHITYLTKAQAKMEIEKIKGKGYAAFISSSGRYFQVCVGGFESRKVANDSIKDLRSKGIVSVDSYIRNVPV